MNGLEIGIAVFLVLMIIAGMATGLIKSVFGMVAFALSAVLSFIVTKLLIPALGGTGTYAAVCFVTVFIIAYIALMVVSFSLNILSHLPVISTLNRIGGAVLGAGLGLLCVWIFMAVVTMLATYGHAVQLNNMLEGSEVLRDIYENNLIDMLLQEHLWSKIEELK